jgi:tRNA (cmo5U34)-methyltransferase
MNEFDIKASGWDLNPMHWSRSEAVVRVLFEMVPLNKNMSVLEYGAGTGITSFLIKDHVKKITMMDSSEKMVRIMDEKISELKATNLKALFFDLEKENWTGPKFDLVVAQMVLHHVDDIKNITEKFHGLLKTNGYLAIADLYPEDGSFHGTGFTGHKGFDPVALADNLKRTGFSNIDFRKCFTINKWISDSLTKQFDIFLLSAINKA